MRTTQAQWSGHRFRPIANAAVSAAAICRAIRVLAVRRRRGARGAVVTLVDGGRGTRPVRCAVHVTTVPQATAASAVTAAQAVCSCPSA